MCIKSPVRVATGGSATALSHRRLGTGPLPVMPLCGVFNAASPVSKDTKRAYSVTRNGGRTHSRRYNSRTSEALGNIITGVW